MIKPNYKNGSIVNLVNSIIKNFDGKNSYPELKLLPAARLKKYRNIILLVIDGLGYLQLKNHFAISELLKHNLGKITSVYPSTTSSAITTFTTGVAPAQHGIIGWYMYLRELATVSTILPFRPRHGGMLFSDLNIKYSQILNQPSVFEKIKVKSYSFLPEIICDTDYNTVTLKNSQTISYQQPPELFANLSKIIKKNGRQYLYAYWGDYDYLSHGHGLASQPAKKALNAFLKELLKFTSNLPRDTLLIATADHGHIDTTGQHAIFVQDHPVIEECLTLPVCGDTRNSVCYLRPDKVSPFKKYIRQNLSEAFTIKKSPQLLEQNFFGLGKPHPQLNQRIGDYILLHKSNYVLNDLLLTNQRGHEIGNHGGTSPEEMYVPLILF